MNALAASGAGAGLRGLAGRAVVYTLANAVASAIPFLLLPLLTRVLSPEDYGRVSMFAVVFTALGAVAGLSVHGAVNVRLFDAGIDHPRYAGTALGVLGLSTSAVLLLVLLAAPWLEATTHLSAAWIALATVAAAAQFAINIRLVVWQARGQAWRYGGLQSAQSALNLGLSVLLVVILALGWGGRAWGMAAATLACGAFAVASLWKSGALRWSFDAGYARDALAFGAPLVPHALGSLAIAASDRFVIATELTLGDVGLYAAAMQLGLVIAVAADAFMKALGPWIYSRLADGSPAARRQVARACAGYVAGLVLLAAVFVSVAPALLLVLGQSFRGGRDILAWVGLGGACSGLYLLAVSFVFYARRTGWLAVASLVTGVGCVGLTFLLVRRNGAVGAAQAYAAAQFLMFAATFLLAQRLRLFPWQRPGTS